MSLSIATFLAVILSPKDFRTDILAPQNDVIFTFLSNNAFSD
jgi:hypothetical protein